MIVTIDGPAGSGKSTVARKLAMRLGFIHLNSGALFRAVGFIAQQKKASLEDDEVVAAIASKLSLRFVLDQDGQTRLFVDGGDLSGELKEESVGELASRVALLPSVRRELLEVQRSTARDASSRGQSLVVEGRDSGTVVFPDADMKFFLDAALEVRAERRLRELNSQERQLDEVRQQLAHRDHTDSTRAIAPQRRPEGAIVIDTSESSPDEVVERMVEMLK